MSYNNPCINRPDLRQILSELRSICQARKLPLYEAPPTAALSVVIFWPEKDDGWVFFGVGTFFGGNYLIKGMGKIDPASFG